MKPFPSSAEVESSPPVHALSLRHLVHRYRMVAGLAWSLVWFALWQLTQLLEMNTELGFWRPETGVAFAAFLMIGWRAFPYLLLGSMAAAASDNMLSQAGLTSFQVMVSALWFTFIYGCCLGAGSWCVRRLLFHRIRHDLPAMIFSVLITALLTSLLCMVLGHYGLHFLPWMAQEHIPPVEVTWWVGHFIGMLTFTPLAIAFMVYLYPQQRVWLEELGILPLQSLEEYSGFITKLLITMTVLAMMMIATVYFKQAYFAFLVFFLCIPQMWIVYTESPLASAVSLAALTTETMLGIQFLALGEQSMVFQFAINVIAACTYFGLSVPILTTQNMQLRQQICHDNLTQTASRHHFFEQAQFELRRARHCCTPISLVVFDIDHFKNINDAYGHTVGDAALLQVADSVRAHLRQGDVLGRFGGDEFMLLLPESNKQAAWQTAERLRSLLSDIKITGCKQSVSGSFGVVEIGPEETVMAAFERADQKLLKAKQGGRNQVIGEQYPSW